MQQKAKEEEAERNRRFFDTTNGTHFYAKSLTENHVGRKVMRTQDGQLVPLEKRDELLMVEHGFVKRTQKATDEELKQRLPQGDYTQTKPVTIYTENLERKNFYMSAATGTNPFAKSSGFTQPLNQTRAVKGYDGNVDFDREQKNVSFMRTTGRDLTATTNPYNPVDLNRHSNFQMIKSSID